MRRPRLLAALIGATAALLAGLLVAAPAQGANILANPGFETGTASPWTCESAQIVGSPVHSGTGAVRSSGGAASTGRCAMTVPVQPSSAYSLSAWVRGSHVYIGATGHTQTWTGSPSAYTQLSTSFTTGADQTSVEVYFHSWYGQGDYWVDDVVLDGPPGDGGGGETGVPGAPGSPRVDQASEDGVVLGWDAAPGEVDGYIVRRPGAADVETTAASVSIMGLAACTSYRFTVSAFNGEGEGPAAEVGARTSGCSGSGLADRALIGYLHTSFANGSGYIRMADVPSEWDVINLAFGEPTSPTSGDIRFSLCPAAECPNVETKAEFIAAIAEQQAQGKKVLLSIGGQNGQVQLTTAAARDAFVSSVGAIIDEYGLDGLDVDLEGHSLYFDAGDTDFRNPTTPVIVNLIGALRSLTDEYGDDFVLSMAPETFFVQVGHQFYGGSSSGDNRTGSYLPVIHALRDRLDVLHVQDYNSGPVMGLDGRYHNMGGADFHIAMTDMLKAGFQVANTGQFFPGLREDQIAFGLPAAVSAGNGYTQPAQVHQALDCLTSGANCGGYELRGGASPGLRGLMTWSINWDRYYGWEFMDSHRPYLDGL
ncbi:glycoside hydrolase family 18 protein [Glycomyces sp. A-F 0318]|uniref:chitinase n=1 Tax=Glycomyces amatae TaxID=2881355 RepID=UPI001E2E7A88|nr:glycoside hydrolase family 18 protein [Glycomyces amatae]MCD0447324.1 glycoside hydrolase family 18 protein [Glycomyces amatae]